MGRSKILKTIVQKMGGRNWEHTVVRLGSYTKHKALFKVIHYKP